MALLFSYGTLQQKEVQIANFGRELSGEPAILAGYTLSETVISDQKVIEQSGSDRHPILHFTGKKADQVSGTCFELSDEELLLADSYEVEQYTRIKSHTLDGLACWIYAATNEVKPKPNFVIEFFKTKLSRS